jgi:hypothetical protein
MEYKVLVKLFVPEIEKIFEVYLPVNKTIGEICIMLNKLINEATSGDFPIKNNIILCDRFTSNFYNCNYYLRDTDIRNGSQLIFI